MIGRLPPPAPGTHILTRLNGACTGFATDTGVASIMQLVIRDMMLLDIVPDLLLRPRDERIDLDELVYLVPLHDLHVLAGDTLLTSQATDPGIEALEGTVERFELANLAATVATLYAVVEEVDALFAHHALHLAVVGEEHLYLYAVGQVGLVNELVGLREEAPGVEGEDSTGGSVKSEE